MCHAASVAKLVAVTDVHGLAGQPASFSCLQHSLQGKAASISAEQSTAGLYHSAKVTLLPRQEYFVSV